MPIVVDALSEQDYAAWVAKMKSATQHAEASTAPVAAVAEK